MLNFVNDSKGSLHLNEMYFQFKLRITWELKQNTCEPCNASNIPHSVLTGDVNAHSTLCHSYTDYHRGQLLADVISNSDHITLNTNTPTRVPTPHYNKHHHQTSQRCLTHFTTGHRGQLNKRYHQTTYP